MNSPEVNMVVSNMLVASLIGVLALLAGRSALRAPLAHVLWVGFFFKLITPPLILLPIAVPASWAPIVTLLPLSESPADDDAVNLPDVVPTSLPLPSGMTEQSVRSEDAVPAWMNVWQLVAMIWISGFVYRLFKGYLRFLKFQRLLKTEARLDPESTQFVANLIQTAHGKSRYSPEVLRVPIRVSPMLFGFGHRPVIVCPDALWTLLSDAERHAFLAHEAAHFCRRDHWVRWLEWLVTSVYWWFPAVYAAQQQLERHEELCCDAWAVRQLNSPPRRYAEALLKVVDFISDHSVGIPQLASGMQPAGSLEERLRLVMRSAAGRQPSVALRATIGSICLTLLLLHPIPQPVASAETTDRIQDNVFTAVPLETNSESPADDSGIVPAPDLPPAPQGFWNRRPEPQWADFSLSLPGAQLTATAGRGAIIQLASGERLSFTSDEMRAIADLPDTQRVVIGQQDGRVRLWDLVAGVPVSLLGQHAAAVTSVAWRKPSGLISADEAGSVIRWDMQSGQVLATTTVPETAVQSVRYSTDGTRVAILSGRWDQPVPPQQVIFADSQTLEAVTSISLSYPAAVVLPSTDGNWLSIDWQGNVRLLETNGWLCRISKENVSALTLVAQDAELNLNITKQTNTGDQNVE